MEQDYTTLNNPKFLFRAEMHQPFPDWVVGERMPESADFEKKASTAFADPARRLLPICTKSAAFHSAINIFARHERYDEAALERVKAACAHYGIEQDVLPYTTLFLDEIEKSASEQAAPEGRFAINTYVGGEEFKLLPLNDADDVASSAADLAKMASESRIHLLMFVPAAREIVKAAADHGNIQLPELITRFGIERFADAAVAREKIKGREQYCKEASLREVVAADYEAALADLETDPDGVMEKIAAIDQAAEVSVNYRVSSMVPTPYDIVFGGALVSDAEKAARENVMVRGVLVPLPALQSVAPMDAEFRLSKSAAEVFSKLRDTDDARDLSIAMESWTEKDQRTILRLAVESAA